MTNSGQEKREENGFLNFSVYFSLRIQNERWFKKVYTSLWEEEHMAEKALSRKAQFLKIHFTSNKNNFEEKSHEMGNLVNSIE